jgi:hypothetical protein
MQWSFVELVDRGEKGWALAAIMETASEITFKCLRLGATYQHVTDTCAESLNIILVYKKDDRYEKIVTRILSIQKFKGYR